MKYRISLSVLVLLISSIAYSQSDFSKHMNEANYSLQQKDYVTAIKKYSKALEYKSANSDAYKLADVYMYRAYCRMSLSNNAGAQEDLDLALKVKPEYTRVYQMKANIYLSTKELNKCIEICNRGLDVKPGDEELMATKASALTGLKKYSESNKVYFDLISENPKSVRSLKMIGNNYQLKKDWDSAYTYFSEAIQLNPLDFESFYDRGICMAEKKDFVNALKDIEKAMAIDTNERFVGYNNIAYFIKLEEKDYKGAIAYYDKAISLKPDFGYAYSNRGFAKMKLGDIPGAFKDIRKSLELDSKNSYAYKNLALVYLADGKKADACYNLKKALELGYKEMYDDEVDTLLKENCSR